MAVDRPRVVVVGAGPAGVRATEALVRHGLRPVVVDEAPKAGGQIYRRPPDGFRRPAEELYGFETAKALGLHRAFDGLAEHIDYRPLTTAWNVQERVLYAVTDDAVRPIPFDALLLATGATDRVLPVPGWTRPGVFSLGGAQMALKHQGCAVGRRTAFVGATPLLHLVAWQYAKAGAEVAAVLDTAPLARKVRALPGLMAGATTLVKGLVYVASLKARGVPVVHGVRPLAIDGDPAVAGLRYLTGDGREACVACDAVALGFGLKPESQLAELAGCAFRFDPLFRQWLPKLDGDGRAGDGLYLAGDGARIGGADAAEAAGELAALALVADLGRTRVPAARVAALRGRLRRLLAFQRALARAFPLPSDMAATLPDAALVCRCEAVTAGELRRVATQRFGAREINRAKALSRVGMGRCQGRFCALGAAEVMAEALGTEIESVGRLRAAGPVKPLKLAAAQVE